ncbi:hypothetical protein [Streptomyces kaempferi]|uniref:Uncharacterized protein n=1 Tax=Streptomyces kaempferi TaxID=333725 RepID=A0ABW3XNK6_9ACTN
MVGAAYDSLGYDGFHDWPLLQDRYTLAVLFEYAATLGLIGIEYVPPVGAREDYRDNWGADDLGHWLALMTRVAIIRMTRHSTLRAGLDRTGSNPLRGRGCASSEAPSGSPLQSSRSLRSSTF